MQLVTNKFYGRGFVDLEIVKATNPMVLRIIFGIGAEALPEKIGALREERS
jgi:hypothetical protein